MMLNSLIRFCIKERLIVSIFTVLLVGWGIYSARNVPIDAIPNVGENQVIVLAAWPGRSPIDVEDQITYPLSIELLSVPGAEHVRGKSMFGYSFVQVTFADDVDFYWARSRVVEQLTTVAGQLPEGVSPELGPDATGLGQILYYTLEPTEGMTLSDLRSLQDFVIKYELQSVAGVSEIASVGGYVRQYQVEVNPDQLRFHGVTLDELIKAVRASNIDVGAKTIESSGMEFIIRGRGFIGAEGDLGKTLHDIEETVVRSQQGIPIRIRDLGQVQVGPDFRRGAIDLNGTEAVGGVVVMRFGENPREVIQRVKAKMKFLEAQSLNGVKFNLVYDRTHLIEETVATLSNALKEEVIVTIVVILLFLLHVRASIVVASTLPLAVLFAFIAMETFGIDANIMSLAGIAIAIGEVADLGIIISENIYRHLADWESNGAKGGKPRRLEVIYEATTEVSGAVVTAVSTTIVSFLPVFFLTGRDYRLFVPLAWTKTFAMIAALLVAVFLVPVMSRLFLHPSRRGVLKTWLASLGCGLLATGLAWIYWGDSLQHELNWPREAVLAIAFSIGALTGFMLSREQLRSIDENPTSRWIAKVYAPTLRLFLRHKPAFLSVPLLIVIVGVGAWIGLPTVLTPFEQSARWVGAELNHLPGYVEAKHTFTGLETDDWIALDEGSWFYMPTLYPAASLSQAMQVLQTQDALIHQIPEVENVLGKIGRAESALDPAPIAMIETYVMLKPKSEWREGITEDDIWEEINSAGMLPGVTPASPLQPIEGRVVMLQSGIKASMAIRIYGDDLDELATAATTIGDQLQESPYVRPGSVNPDIVMGKPYVEFEVDRATAARFGMSVATVNEVIEAALGGMNVTQTVEGRERYPIRVRYQRDLRERIDELKRLPVVARSGEVVPLEMLAKMSTVWGPGMISSEDARLVAHVMFSPSGVVGDLETARLVEESLKQAVESGRVPLPTGYTLQTVGSFENQIEANRRLKLIVPIVILINMMLIYLQFRKLPITLAIFSAIPVSFAGGMITLAIFGVEMNTAVWIGFIALFGIAVDDGVIMATYLQQSFQNNKPSSIQEIREAVVEAGLKRIRPCLMTTLTTFSALTPIMLATGRGADVARSMAIPVFGGMAFELITLFVLPVLDCSYRELRFRTGQSDLEEP
ncbi:MAG TPA: efflux RND transporter permease subunit [Planctomycetaceae bacterium]|nr:efflux RND transporter permease subunit [Planctomycetaceae bacterium]